MNDQKQKILDHLIRPLEKIYGAINESVLDYYVEDFQKFTEESLKDIFVDVRKAHTEKHFPLIADIYQICGLNDSGALLRSDTTYHKQLHQEWLDKKFPSNNDIKQTA